MMNVTKRCHYLPQSYLENFVTENKKTFWVYYKGEAEPVEQTPINTGIEKHLYTYMNQKGEINDSIENKVLANYEGKAATIINKLLKYKDSLLEQEKIDLAIFLALMAVRVPRSINAMKEFGESLISTMLNNIQNQPEMLSQLIVDYEKTMDNTISSDDIINFLDRIGIDIHIKMNKKSATAMNIITAFELYKDFLDMNWCLCRAPYHEYFITGDCPLVCFVLNNDGTAIFGAGFRRSNAEVSFPLSPEKCLYLDRNHHQKYRAVSKKFVREINRRTAWIAEKFLISHKKDEYINNLINWASASIGKPYVDKSKLHNDYLNGCFA